MGFNCLDEDTRTLRGSHIFEKHHWGYCWVMFPMPAAVADPITSCRKLESCSFPSACSSIVRNKKCESKVHPGGARAPLTWSIVISFGIEPCQFCYFKIWHDKSPSFSGSDSWAELSVQNWGTNSSESCAFGSFGFEAHVVLICFDPKMWKILVIPGTIALATRVPSIFPGP